MFIEGQKDPVQILNGTVHITDPDHPIYALQSASIILLSAQENHELLYLNNSFTFVSSKVST